jgi:alkylresorcinol/alkylpyrone synthase
MSHLEAAAAAFPPRSLSQAEALEWARKAYSGRDRLRALLRVFETSGVRRRHFAFAPEYYLAGKTFEERNADFVEQGLALAERAARACLEKAHAAPASVDHLFLATTTGLATPSLDALLVPRLGLREDVRRSPLFGLGCAGGAGALIRAGESLRPGGRALVVAVELCGQVFSPRALEPVDVIGSALFGDGAAAVLVSDGGPGPRVVRARSQLFEGTRHLMGWAFTGDGMRLRLSPEVAEFVRGPLKLAVAGFLREAGLEPGDIRYWILHPGGRRVLDTYREAFGLADQDLRWSRDSLERVGNLSSASVLSILADILEDGRPRAGEKGLMVAVGPGFAAEMLVLEW